MTSPSNIPRCERSELLYLYARSALPQDRVGDLEAHVAACADCQHELSQLRGSGDAIDGRRADILESRASLWNRVAQRIAPERRADPAAAAELEPWLEPAWEQVAPGIWCQVLACDMENDLVSMLVRLAPRVEYPPHTHAGVEELHLLDGELWIDERKLYPGDYNRAEPGTSDARVWSETGCTCVLTTSSRDVLHC